MKTTNLESWRIRTTIMIPYHISASLVSQWSIGLNGRTKPENSLSRPENDKTTYEDETTITYISFPIYKVYIVNPVIFCVDTAPMHSCIADKELEKIVAHSGRKSIPIIDSKCDFKISDILVGPVGMVELVLPTPGSTLDITIILGLWYFCKSHRDPKLAVWLDLGINKL